MQILSHNLFGQNLDIRDFPISARNLRGMGMSDAPHYAERLKRAFDYTNYFYHTTPYLDITCPPQDLYGKFDFIISSDVFEHVPPPRWTPLQESWKLLKPGGLLVFSVPYTNLPKTAEWFPQLHQFVTIPGKSEYTLVNHTSEGELQLFQGLNWHGGPGSTLELRVYAEAHLRWLLEKCGFTDIQFHGQDYPGLGIVIAFHQMSFMISARKGAALLPINVLEEAEYTYLPGHYPSHELLAPPEQIDKSKLIETIRDSFSVNNGIRDQLAKNLLNMRRTLSWKVTQPLRFIRRLFC